MKIKATRIISRKRDCIFLLKRNTKRSKKRIIAKFVGKKYVNHVGNTTTAVEIKNTMIILNLESNLYKIKNTTV
jgi:ribosomal protein S19